MYRCDHKKGTDYSMERGEVLRHRELKLFPLLNGSHILPPCRVYPESNGMAEAFVKTFKRDYVRIHEIPDAVSTDGATAGVV
jgi:hypothetical protein